MNTMLNETNQIQECLTSSIIELLYKNGSVERAEKYSPIVFVNIIAKIISVVFCNWL